MVVFLLGSGLGFLGLFCVTHWNADPLWLMVVFPLLLAIVLGTRPVLAYSLERWIKRLEVTCCPACGEFLWRTEYHAMRIAVFPRCPRCCKPLVDSGGESDRSDKEV